MGVLLATDLGGWARLTKTTLAAGGELHEQFREGMKHAAELVADGARELIEPYSATIPPSIQIRMGAEIEVVAGGADVPLAGLFEAGNRGQSGGDMFTHPVFGNANVTVTQAMHPYLQPAEERHAVEIEAKAMVKVDEAIETVRA